MAKRNTYFQDEVIQRKIDAKQLGRTLRYVLPYKKVFLLVGVLMFVSSLVALIPSLILKRITDVVIPNEDYAALAYMVLSMALLAVVETSFFVKKFFTGFFLAGGSFLFYGSFICFVLLLALQ